MEVAAGQNQLQESLTECLGTLHFEQGKPSNSEQVISEFVEIMVAYFAENTIQYVFSYIGNSFETVKGLFLDERTYMFFLNKLAVPLKARVDSLASNLYDDESEYGGGATASLRSAIFDGLKTSLRFIQDTAHDIEIAPIREIEKAANSIDHKLPLGERYELAQRLNLMIAWLASAGRLSTTEKRSRDEYQKTLLPDAVKELSWYDKVSFHYGDGDISPDILEPVLATIKSIEAEKKFMDVIGHADKAQINRDRLVFGAKGANLLAVQDFLSKFKGTDLEYLVRRTSIPPFSLIDVGVYKKWKNKEDIGPVLRSTYEKHKNKPLMVRSSAVYSEDGEKMTGAGIYLSLPLEQDASFEQFKSAVEKVYESCDAEEGAQYRKQNDVEEEYMGIVVQEKIEYPDLHQVNSTRPYSDDTTDMTGDHQKAPLIFNTPQFDQRTFLSDTGLDLFNWATRVESEYLYMDHCDLEVTNIIAFARLLEKYYGQPVQIEFAQEYYYEDERGMHFHFFQARPLPAKMFEAPRVEFPQDVVPLYECYAEGVCDQVLEVLNVYAHNNDKDGFTVYRASWQGSSERANLSRAMPKKGAAMILAPSEHGRGHIETLALERGVTLLFHRQFADRNGPNYHWINEDIRSVIFKTLDGLGLTGAFAGHKKVRIVANGKIARIYPA